ncbi:hypothetical protein HGRIS_004176 [Hohenbuehelia grisea]|uniref:Uncharacterized protein n=1 Tax=Hohenbuehelia grisea TaxID=104357 RepID=A0ABR3JJG4_9AGAR
MPDDCIGASALDFADNDVVAVGGTAGIGAAIALPFPELGASVLSVGRNQKAGDELVGLPRKSSPSRLAFLRWDLGSLEEIKASVEGITTWAGDAGV